MNMDWGDFVSYSGLNLKPKVTSFRVYKAKAKPIFKAKYPFLSDDQINRRAKQEWKKMTEQVSKLSKSKVTKMKSQNVKLKQSDKNSKEVSSKAEYDAFGLQIQKSSKIVTKYKSSCTKKSLTNDVVFGDITANLNNVLNQASSIPQNTNSSTQSDEDSDDSVLIRRCDFQAEPLLDQQEHSQNNLLQKQNMTDCIDYTTQKRNKRHNTPVDDEKERHETIKKKSGPLKNCTSKGSNSHFNSGVNECSQLTEGSKEKKSVRHSKAKRGKKQPATVTPVILPADTDEPRVTPALRSKEAGLEDITPQVDIALHQTILNKINKTPKKRNKKKASRTSSSKSRRSKVSGARKLSTNPLHSKTMCAAEAIDRQSCGTPNKENRLSLISHAKEYENIQTDNVDLNEEAKSLDKALLLRMNPSGDAFGHSPKNIRFTCDKTGSVNQIKYKVDKSEHDMDEDSATKLSQHDDGDFESLRQAISFQSNAQTLCNSQSPYSSDTESLKKENPILLRSLSNLQMCTSAVDQIMLSPLGHSESSSPRLLSPALSGISEITSITSSSSQPEESGRIAQEQQGRKSSADRDLCNMFQDVTPPEKKTSGEFKTKRMLVSEAGDRNDNFQKLFGQEEDFFF